VSDDKEISDINTKCSNQSVNFALGYDAICHEKNAQISNDIT